MTYSLIDLSSFSCSETPAFIEGAILAANFALKPMPVEQWLPKIVGDDVQPMIAVVETHFHQQYARLMANQYAILSLLQASEDSDTLNDFAEGFMTVWAEVEQDWAELVMADGSMRMLQALLTTMMLAIDEPQTQQQMREAGVETPPQLADLIINLDLMINEVANVANDQQVGGKSIRVNPFKEVGRNDHCICGSGKKYKQCCGR